MNDVFISLQMKLFAYINMVCTFVYPRTRRIGKRWKREIEIGIRHGYSMMQPRLQEK